MLEGLRLIAATCAAVLLGGCGTGDTVPTNASMQTGATTAVDDPSTSAVTSTTRADGQSTTLSPETTGLDTTLGPVTNTDEGGGFLPDPDGGTDFECDLFAQGCPAGEKCMPWANDGSGVWNAARCSPVARNPAQPGDPCMVEGSATSGIDDCDFGSMCWDVDPKTNVGTCVAMCTGSYNEPFCEDPSTQCQIGSSGVIILCLFACSPLIQDCPRTQACYPVNDNWECVPDASGYMGAYGDACEFINVCDPGLVCLGSDATPGCPSNVGCCTEICDVSDPEGDDQCTGAVQGQTCQSWSEPGAARPGYEDVGVCAIPR
ncbi:MAG: ribulose phosphate epimerase [Deltaproteobacteria bacterium]|nr:ribulose phosphate epimerase [Deltaproteobacteria bacterium]